jgi:transcription termination factor NusA
MDTVEKIAGVGEKTAQLLNQAGYLTVADLSQTTIDQLTKIEGIGPKKAGKLLESARAHLDKTEDKKE